MLHPITFSIPLEKVVNQIYTKTKILSDLIPGKMSTYIYSTETDYYNEYRQSYFAMTTKKAGWDCMRHYEIITNACIPYFPDIESCPPNTMALLPKDLIIEGNSLYFKFVEKGITEENTKSYVDLVKRFIQYTKNHLTTHRIAEYILKKISFTKTSRILGNENDNIPITLPTLLRYGADDRWVEKVVTRSFRATNEFFGDPCPGLPKHVETVETNILFLSGSTYSDYLRCLTLHGFKSLLGSKCHDYPKISHIYKNDIDPNTLYGKGMSYRNLLENSLHDDSLDTKLEILIKKKFFDLVIYGSYHRGMPLFDLVNQFYKPNEVVLLCGEDIHQCNYADYVKKGFNVFVREL